MSAQLSHRDMEGIPSKWLEVIVHFISGFRNDTVDFGRPHLRSSFLRLYPLFVVLYGALVVCGTACNALLLFSVFSPGEERSGRTRRRERSSTEGSVAQSERDPTLCLLANLAAADVVKCLVVLPVSLAVLLVQNWVFGSFMCFFVPMMQDIPIHVSMLSFLLIAADRHRFLMDPMKPRFPPLFCSLAAWLLAICIVLPYPVYTTYLDLGAFMKDQFQGVGICIVNLGDDLQEYMRGLFIAMYVVPLAVIAFLYVRVSRELKMLRERDGGGAPMAMAMNAVAASGHPPDYEDGAPRRNPSRTSERADNSLGNGATPWQGVTSGESNRREEGCCRERQEEVRQVIREQRTQKYLIAMVVVFATCLFPLMVLRLAKLALAETYENSAHFDIVFAAFVWFAFLPTTSTPCLYAAWRLSRTKKERLGDCLRRGRRRGRRQQRRPDEEEECGGGAQLTRAGTERKERREADEAAQGSH